MFLHFSFLQFFILYSILHFLDHLSNGIQYGIQSEIEGKEKLFHVGQSVIKKSCLYLGAPSAWCSGGCMNLGFNSVYKCEKDECLCSSKMIKKNTLIGLKTKKCTNDVCIKQCRNFNQLSLSFLKCFSSLPSFTDVCVCFGYPIF